MVHGAPDDSNVVKSGPVYRVEDQAELAARLGAVSTYDRRGDTLWADQFERGIGKWEQLASEYGNALYLSIARARNAGYSMEMVAGSGGDVDVTAIHHMASLPKGPMGLEVSFTLGDDTGYVEIALQMWDGALFHHGLVSYRKDLERIQYLDENNAQQVLQADVKFYDTGWRFHTMKVVVDFENNEYVRCMLDDVEYDMSDLSCYAPANTDPRDLKMLVIHHGTSAVNASNYIDGVIVTQNEP